MVNIFLRLSYVKNRVRIFKRGSDQFEEILTTNLQYWAQRESFFRQLRQAIDTDPLLWVVLSLREDYVAALDPYARLLPGKLRTRFYMQRLNHIAALEAIARPATKGGRPFASGVAKSLVDNLRQLHTYDQAEPHLGQFVEPVQLQVVCYQLWENLKERPPGEITRQDLQELGNIDTALAQFYEQALARVLAETGDVAEAYLRDWFEQKLITEAGTRGIVYRGTEKTGGLSTPAADLLANQFLLRSENRAGGIWYELVHDRFVEPILKANQAWRLQQGLLEKLDHLITIRLAEPEQTVEVERTATYELTITNSGAMAAQFMVRAQGLDQSWLTISRPAVSLEEGKQAVVLINVTPPRRPTSTAGAYDFTLTVTSPDYPNRYSQRQARLHIKPYYDFALSELSPRRQTISWFKHSGQTAVSIVNQGNAQARFEIEGTDTQQSCSFEFQVPGEAVALAQRAGVSIPADSTASIPVQITPYSRRLMGFSTHRHDFTITTSLLDGQQVSRSVLGQLRTRPLIGSWLLLMITLWLVLLITLMVRPRLYVFMSEDGRQTVIRNNTPVAMRWAASYFTSDLRLEPEIKGLEQPLPRRGTVVAYPKTDTTYSLKGGNLLSSLAPVLFAPPTQSIRVEVDPIPPEIIFEAEPNQIVGQEEVVLQWVVENADKVEIFRQVGLTGPVELIGDFSDMPFGSLPVIPEPDQDSMTYILVASNAYVLTPTPVPQLVTIVTPTPAIVYFTADPPVINEGQEAILSWQVEGIQFVTIQEPGNVQNILPAEYSLPVRPTGSVDYSLIVPGVPSTPARVEVTPATPTPTPAPAPGAPLIALFAADPVSGDETQVQLTWSVLGEFTNIQLSSPHYHTLANLAPEGTILLAVNQTTAFVLSVFNGDQVSSRMIGIRLEGNNVSVVLPTVTATPTGPATPISTDTATP